MFHGMSRMFQGIVIPNISVKIAKNGIWLFNHKNSDVYMGGNRLSLYHPSYLLWCHAALYVSIFPQSTIPLPIWKVVALVDCIFWGHFVIKSSKQTYNMTRVRVRSQDSHPALYVVSDRWNRLGSVLSGPGRTGLALPWTTYRAGGLSWDLTLTLVVLYVWFKGSLSSLDMNWNTVFFIQSVAMFIMVSAKVARTCLGSS